MKLMLNLLENCISTFFQYFLLKKKGHTIEKRKDGVKLLVVSIFGNWHHAGSNLGLQDKNRCVEVSVETGLKVINNELLS